MIKGAVFDMDGLMFDSERLVYSVWQEMMDENGYGFDIEIFKNTIGLRRDESERFYKSIYGESFPYDRFKEQGRRRFFERIEENGVPVKKGLLELLDFLKSRKIKIALATSTSGQSARSMIEKAGVLEYFDGFVFGEDVTKGKPHPEPFLKAAQRLGLGSEYCVAFEDSINGIKSASAANMTTVMVPDLLCPTDEIKGMISFLCEDLSLAIEFLEDKT